MRTLFVFKLVVGLRWWLALLCGGSAILADASAATPGRGALGAPAVEESLAMESRTGLRRGMSYLLDQQLPDGSWARHPALTGLAVLALLNAPGELRTPESAAAAARAAGWLRQRLAEETVAPPGGEVSPRPILHLAVGSWGLIRFGLESDYPRLCEVRARLLAAQCLELPGDSSAYGGFRPHARAAADFMTTAYALETLQLMGAVGLNGGTDTGAVSTPPTVISAAAGWLWHRVMMDSGESSAAARKWTLSPDLTGLQAAVALKSLFYAGAAADDPRISALCAWFGERANFEENPGAGEAGYYTYIFTVTQALRGCERQGQFTAPLKKCVDWRRKTLEALLKRQAGDGGWHQSFPDWWETRPELTTAYALLAMELAL